MEIKTLEKATEEAKASNKMLLDWAEKQGRGIIRQMEQRRHALTLSLSWSEVRKGWLGGFVSGVSTGFQLGFKTSNNLSKNFIDGVGTAVQGTEAEVIQTRNAELKSLLGEAVGEASMCWSNPEGAGIFQSDRAEAIVQRLYERFLTPVPVKVAMAVTETPVEEEPRLPGL